MIRLGCSARISVNDEIALDATWMISSGYRKDLSSDTFFNSMDCQKRPRFAIYCRDLHQHTHVCTFLEPLSHFCLCLTLCSFFTGFRFKTQVQTCSAGRPRSRSSQSGQLSFPLTLRTDDDTTWVDGVSVRSTSALTGIARRCVSE